MSNLEETVAFPLSVVPRGDDDTYLDELVGIAREREVGRIVVGHPRRLDGTEGPEAEAAVELAGQLRARLDLPVTLVDERFTTRVAEDALSAGKVSARKQRPVVDKVAASLLLQGFLDAQSSKSETVERA